MSRILLVSNAHHDNQTEYLTSWFEKVVEVAKKQNDIKIIELKKEQANKKNLVEMIEKENPQFIIFNGHGNDDSICGFNHEILIKCDDNEVLLSGKIVHSMACKCANILGGKCITLGTKCFIGYKEDFELWSTKQKTKEDQLKDGMAGFFLNPAYEAIIALVEGSNAGEAFRRSQNMYKENILTLITSKNTHYSTIVANSLYSNFQNQVCLGDKITSF
ncbi:MAG: hypothetical protein Q8O89_04095 [Nanoarchaeota archaeon]|nr:hypothetical protein [Nanoarchaeota archaeon]